MITSGKPSQIYKKLEKQEGRLGVKWKIKTNTPRLTTTTSNFVTKCVKIWNRLDTETKNATDKTFKEKCKLWTRRNIPIKPGQKEKCETFKGSLTKPRVTVLKCLYNLPFLPARAYRQVFEFENFETGTITRKQAQW